MPTGSSSDFLICRIRKKELQGQPEEHIRQQWLSYLIDQRGYSEQLLAVEVSLKSLSHLQNGLSLPQRRADILCFTSTSDAEWRPYLLIECKASPLLPKMIRQLLGYNYYVQAPFVALVNQEEAQVLWHRPDGEYQAIEQLPPPPEKFAEF